MNTEAKAFCAEATSPVNYLERANLHFTKCRFLFYTKYFFTYLEGCWEPYMEIFINYILYMYPGCTPHTVESMNAKNPNLSNQTPRGAIV